MQQLRKIWLFVMGAALFAPYAQGPAGYTECAKEQNFTEPANVAYGNNGTYKYLFNQLGPFIFDNHPFFGGNSGTSGTKNWCQTVSSMDIDGTSSRLGAALNALKKHIDGSAPLDSAEQGEQYGIIRQNISAIGIKKDIIALAFELVDAYETVIGPLFAGGKEYARNPAEIKSWQVALQPVDYAVMFVQDHITRSYSSAKLEEFPDVYEGAWFKTSERFPGKVDAVTDPANVRTVKINASNALNWGTPVMFHDGVPSRRATGSYLAPGTIVKVKVPASIVNKGYRFRVGAHYWDLTYRTKIRRLDRATIIYPVLKEEVTLGSPLGGGIYLDVPDGSDAGVISLTITGAARSPFFSARPENKTTLAEWVNTERSHPGPWTDFESEKFILQVPTSWCYAFDDPVTMMRNWDRGMDAVNYLLGKPELHGTHSMYVQVDVIFRGTANYPGYPMVNITYNPAGNDDGTGKNSIFKGPHVANSVLFHELGHSHVPSFFGGERESIVNLLSVAVDNYGFGIGMDSAFSRSRDNRKDLTLKEGVVSWMIAEDFWHNRRMADSVMAYQFRGHAKYVDVARLFGWGALNRFYKKLSEDYNDGLVIPKTNHPVDDRILRMSVGAGVDLRPLMHFWGFAADDFNALANSIAGNNLPQSQRIYDALETYKTYVPKNLQECQAHVSIMYPKNPPSPTGWLPNRQHFFCSESWTGAHADSCLRQIRMIQELYFPDGRPDTPVTMDIQPEKKESPPRPYFRAANGYIEAVSKGPHILSIYSLRGRLLKTFRGTGRAGYSLKPLNGKGLHLVRLTVPGAHFDSVKRIVLK